MDGEPDGGVDGEADGGVDGAALSVDGAGVLPAGVGGADGEADGGTVATAGADVAGGCAVAGALPCGNAANAMNTPIAAICTAILAGRIPLMRCSVWGDGPPGPAADG